MKVYTFKKTCVPTNPNVDKWHLMQKFIKRIVVTLYEDGKNLESNASDLSKHLNC